MKAKEAKKILSRLPVQSATFAWRLLKDHIATVEPIPDGKEPLMYLLSKAKPKTSAEANYMNIVLESVQNGSYKNLSTQDKVILSLMKTDSWDGYSYLSAQAKMPESICRRIIQRLVYLGHIKFQNFLRDGRTVGSGYVLVEEKKFSWWKRLKMWWSKILTPHLSYKGFK